MDRPVVRLVLITCVGLGACNAILGNRLDEDAVAAVAADASTGRFCSTIDSKDLVLCDDFDDRGIDRWNRVDSDKETRYGVSTEVFSSPPNAARCEIAAGDGASQEAQLSRRLVGTVSHLEIRAKLRVLEPGSLLTKGQIFSVDYGSGVFDFNANGSFWVNERLADGGTRGALQPGIAAVPSNKWVELVFDIDLATKLGRLTLEGSSQNVTLHGARAEDPIMIIIGPAEVDGTTRSVVVYDDIVARRIP